MFNALTFDIETAKRAGGDLRVFYAGETDLTKDRTMQAEYYGVRMNAGLKINF